MAETLGLEAYYPKLSSQRTIRRVRRRVVGPLFPRYLFCRFDPSYYRGVRFAPDVIDLVHSGEGPVIVEDRLIQELKSWAGESVDLITVQPSLRPGDRIEVIDGPMRGMSAIILHADDERDRVAVLLSILQCGAQAQISRSQIRRIG